VLPSGDSGARLPDEEDEDSGGSSNDANSSRGGSSSGSSSASPAPGGRRRNNGGKVTTAAVVPEAEEEEELSPLRALQDMEAGLDAFPPSQEEEEEEEEEGDDVGDLDATRTGGRRHPFAGSSPPPSLPGMATLLHGAAPPPPLFPRLPKQGCAAAGAATHLFLPPALATMTPVSSKHLPASGAGAAVGAAAAPRAVAAAAAPMGGSAAAAVAGAAKRNSGLGTKDVFWTSAETMWGVLIFLRFGWCVGQVGLVPTLGAVLLSAACQALCASSLSAVATNGLITRSGGMESERDADASRHGCLLHPSPHPISQRPPAPPLPTHTGAYFMLVKALGLGPGASVGFFYWLGMTALMAVEIYGFAEGGACLLPACVACVCVCACVRVLVVAVTTMMLHDAPSPHLFPTLPPRLGVSTPPSLTKTNHIHTQPSCSFATATTTRGRRRTRRRTLASRPSRAPPPSTMTGSCSASSASPSSSPSASSCADTCVHALHWHTGRHARRLCC
jgi:hypothetical protein